MKRQSKSLQDYLTQDNASGVSDSLNSEAEGSKCLDYGLFDNPDNAITLSAYGKR